MMTREEANEVLRTALVEVTRQAHPRLRLEALKSLESVVRSEKARVDNESRSFAFEVAADWLGRLHGAMKVGDLEVRKALNSIASDLYSVSGDASFNAFVATSNDFKFILTMGKRAGARRLVAFLAVRSGGLGIAKAASATKKNVSAAQDTLRKTTSSKH